MPPVVVVEPELLKRIPLFRDLDSDALSALAASATLRRCDAGQAIIEQDIASEAVYVILRGRASVSVAARDGRTLTIREIGQLEIVGEVSLFDGGLPSATVTALSNTELLGLERRTFMALIRDQPRIAVALLPVLATRLRRLTTWADDFAGLPLSARLAKCLLGLLALHGQQLGPSRIRIGQRFSQEELARRVGVTRESINKHLGRFEKDGILLKESGYLVVVDLARLQAEGQRE
jgi:CRP-like cAMP-binding protein